MTMTMIAGKTTDPARGLALAAAPTFAGVALIALSDAPPLTLCAAGATILPVDGMTAMYLLTSLFHRRQWEETDVPGGTARSRPEPLCHPARL